jgi:hypothetical protein
MKIRLRTRRLSRTLTICVTAGALSCFAQELSRGVATLRSAAGNVLVSNEYGLATADASTRLTRGARIMTTIRSQAEIVYDDGCHVPMEENKVFTVEMGQSCEWLRSQVKPMFESPSMASLGSPGNLGASSLVSPTGSVGAAGSAGTVSATGSVGSLSTAGTLGAKGAALSASAAGSAGTVGATVGSAGLAGTAGTVGAVGSVNSVVGLASAAAASGSAVTVAAAAAATAAGYTAINNSRVGDAVSPS